ncbi:MAG: hypothetical protein Q8P67_17380, partial [archaeon]|nr:hypothetical protein [archaeon]
MGKRVCSFFLPDSLFSFSSFFFFFLSFFLSFFLLRFYDNEGHSLFPEPSSDVPYTPSTLHLLPPDIHKPAMINNLHLFCYPEGMYIRAVGEAEPPKFHPFVMTDELADIKYGACISFDVPLAADDPSQPPPKWRPEASSAAVVSASASASASVVFPRVPSKPSIVDQLPTSLKLMASRSSETTGGSDRFSTETPSSSPASSLSPSDSAENLITKQKIAAAAARGGLHNRSEDDCLPSIGFEVSPSSSAGMLDSPDSPKSIFRSPPDTPQRKSAISPSSSVVELQSATSIKSSASRVTFQSRGRATSISELVDQPTRPRSRSPNPLRRAPQQPSNSLPSSSTLSSSPPSSSYSSTSSLPATTSSLPLPANALSPAPMRKASGKLHPLDPSKRPVSSLHSASMAPSLSAMKPVLPPSAPKPQRWPLAMPKITPFASPAPQSQPEWLGRCSICIVSRWPFFEFFREYLTTILYLAEQPGGMACPIEHYFKCLVYSAPVPPPTAAVLGLGLSFTIEDIKLPPLSRPALFDFPAIDFPLRFIFKALDIENVLLIIAAILTEKKILFVSSSYSLLTYAAESFVSLIYPLTWSPHTYVPILPLKLIEAVQAPTPFIMGLHSAHIAEISEQSRQGLVVVALDQNIVMSSTDLAEVPRKESRLLSSILMRILHPEIVDMDLVQLPKTASAPTPDNFRWQNSQIRLAFLSFTASLLTDYRQYTQTSDFDIGGFLGTKDASSQAFFSQFTETQGFQNLLRDSMISGPPPLISRLLDCTAQADTIDSLLLLYHGSRCPGT